MEEKTNIDYEKMYKATLETAMQWIKDGCTDKERICLESVFPELRESEDERIMREFNDWLCEEIEWRTNDLRDEKDRRTLNMLCYILTKVKDWLEKQKESSINEEVREAILHYFNVEMLASDDETEKQILREWIAWVERHVEGDFARGYDSGYEACLNSHSAEWLEKQKEQKPHRVAVDTCEAIDKVREFDEQIEKEQKPAEWSEEDDRILKGIIGKIDHDQSYGVSKKDMLDFLNDIRIRRGNIICVDADRIQEYLPKITWKPSEEQMKHLERCFSHGHTSQLPNQHVLESLYNELKKLK